MGDEFKDQAINAMLKMAEQNAELTRTIVQNVERCNLKLYYILLAIIGSFTLIFIFA